MTVAETAEPSLLLALGDSITAGVGGKWNRGYPNHLHDRLKLAHSDLELINWGIPGLTIPRLTSALQRGTHLHDRLRVANWIVLTIGGNDIIDALKDNLRENAMLSPTQREALAHNLDVCLVTLLALTDGPLYLGNLYNPFPRSELAARMIGAMNDAYYAPLARRYKRVRIVNLHDVLLGQEPQSIEYYRSGSLGDMKRFWRRPIHPNDEGHRLLGEAFYQAILADR